MELYKLVAIRDAADIRKVPGAHLDLPTAYELISDLASILIWNEMEQEAIDSGCKTTEEIANFIDNLQKRFPQVNYHG